MNLPERFIVSIVEKKDGDWVDRLNARTTAVVLVVSSVLLAGWCYVGQPIQCWFPAEFRGSWQQYALDICYAEGTYFVPMFEKTDNFSAFWRSERKAIPLDESVKDEASIAYYQWVPFILLLQALLFYLPGKVWEIFCSHGNLNISAVLSLARWRTADDKGDYQKNMQMISSHIRHKHANNASAGKYTLLTYLFCKALMAANVLFQFHALGWILGISDPLWGWNHLVSLFLPSGETEDIAHFPRVTLCDFSIRALGVDHNHTIQCLLTVNIFNEKIFLVQWFWFIFLFAATITSLLEYTYFFTIPGNGLAFVKRYWKQIESEESGKMDNLPLLKDFVEQELRCDGIFILKMIIATESELVAVDLLRVLWDNFKNREALSSDQPLKEDEENEDVASCHTTIEEDHRPPQWQLEDLAELEDQENPENLQLELGI